MEPQTKRFNRRLHFWLAIVIFVPTFIVFASGLVLQVKKQVEWVQPSTQKGKKPKDLTVNTIALEQAFAIVQKIPQVNVTTWDDVARIDIRPNKSMMKVITEGRWDQQWEVQVDLYSGEVLQISERRSDWIEAIHDGSFFHPDAKLWLFLPNGLLLFIMWISGLIMFAPILRQKWKRKLR